MEPKAFEDELRSELRELRQELNRLRPLAERKKEKDVALNINREITAHDIMETLQRSLDEIEAQADGLTDITLDAWKNRGSEIRRETERTLNDLRERFESLAESLKQQ